MFLRMLLNMLKEEVGWSNFLRLIFEAWETWKQIQLGEVAASDLACLQSNSFFNLKYVFKERIVLENET